MLSPLEAWLCMTQTTIVKRCHDEPSNFFCNPPDENYKKEMVDHFPHDKRGCKKFSKLFARGPNVCWMVNLWCVVLENCMKDPILKNMRFYSCLRLLKDKSGVETYRFVTDAQEKDVVPFQIGLMFDNFDTKKEDVIFEWILHHINTYVCGLSLSWPNMVIGWDTNKHKFSFLFGKSATNKKGKYKPKNALLNKLFGNFSSREILDLFELTISGRQQTLTTFFEKLLYNTNNLFFYTFYSCYGFLDFKKEVIMCNERCRELFELMKKE